LGIEAYWLDACWYGTGREWWQEVGNWTVRRSAFPDGLAPLGKAAHERGMRFVLWFEPERVRPDTAVAREHPEFLLRCPAQPDNHLFNLGDPSARGYMADLLVGVIAESGVDVYRQDFNFDPLPYWQAADAPDRVGISEIRHTEGLYALWDELRARRPGLLIDNCASGGRRLDLETISRSFPLWRSDFSDVGGPAHGPLLQIADQIQTAGLSLWVPLHTAAVWTFTPYDFRSAMAAGVVPYCSIQTPEFPAAAARAAIAELKSLRPFYRGDFHLLLPLTSCTHDWCAYQYHRPDMGAGFAVFFRRHESPFPTAEVRLRGLEPRARYAVSLAEGFEPPPETERRGEDLERLSVDLRQAPGSVLLRYRRI
jgi:alpha-galactosidase